ncbi:hypothetical protein [Streptomyces sp. NPDC023327]|uniref:hypothetical protein n=1 Tax=Streptomyces sp. NPDC023327 TaxID=3157088 RepID=UPI0033C342B7
MTRVSTAAGRPAYRCTARAAAGGLIGLGLAMVPWLIVLHTWLPGTAESARWAWAWTGLDCLEAAGMLATGVLLRRGDPRGALTAAATATLLLVDAWFDTMTAAPGADLTSALLMAACAELPLAVTCAVLAVRTCSRAGAGPRRQRRREG